MFCLLPIPQPYFNKKAKNLYNFFIKSVVYYHQDTLLLF